MKKSYLLVLLLSGSATAWAQNSDPFSRLDCLEPPVSSQQGKKQPGDYPLVLSAKTATARPPGPGTASCPGVININIHFMLRMNGTGNFNETNNGFAYKPWNANGQRDPIIPADTANNGYARALALVTEMNNQAASNPLNSNPAGTSNPPKGFSYALNGVYFHRVGQTDYQTIKDDFPGYESTVPFDTYGVNKPTEINVFMMGNYTNGACCDHGGIACRIGYDPATPNSYWVKTFNTYELYCWRQQNNGNTIPLPSGPYTIPQDSQYLTANTLGHEIGHLLGLHHVFHGANNCTDAAVPSRGNSGNNQMDYTAGTSLTACQLAVVNTHLYNPGNPADSYHNYLTRSICGEVPPRAFFMPFRCMSSGSVRIDSRGTFMADQMTIKVYDYNSATATPGALLASYTRPVTRGGIWSLARLCAFVAGQSYYVTLTATRTSGQSHTLGRVIQVTTEADITCTESMPQEE